MRKYLKHLDTKRRVLSLVLAFVFVISTFMSGTLTWFASASAVNEFSGHKGDYSVILSKLQKDGEGNLTEDPIENAEFYLYRITGTDPEVVEQIGESYRTDAEGLIQVSGLASGNYYFLETNPSYSFDYDSEDGAAKTKYPFTVGADSEQSNEPVKVKAYNIKKTADLMLTKKVENQDGTELTDEQKEMSFEFQVVFSDGKTYPYTIDGGEEQTLPEDGKLYLKHGQSAVFKKVPVGVQYTITEAAVEEYAISSENSTGNILPEGNKAVFTNLHVPKEKVSSLVISKKVTGLGDPEQLFEFTVVLGTDDTIEYPYRIVNENDEVVSEGSLKSGEKIQLKHNQRAVFPNIPIGLEYSVTETPAEGYISLTESQNGMITDACNVVPFVNDIPYGELTVKKTVEGEEADLSKGFSFTAVIGDKTYEFVLANGESKTFKNIPIGTKYTVVEADYSEEGYLTSSINSVGTIEGDSKTAEFVNTKQEIPEVLGSLTVMKHVVNGNPDDSFKFHVQIGDDVQEITLKDGEKAEFTDIPVGTHYSVIEENYYEQGYITTSKGASGTISQEGVTAEYTNTKMDSVPEVGSLHINKKVSGAGDPEKAFDFQVTFSEEGEYTFRIDDGKEGTTDEEEKIYTLPADGMIHLKHGETAIFENLPAELKYTITESDYSSDGYIQGVLSQSGMISLNTAAYADFNNYKEPEKKDGKLIVKKITTGEGADLDKKFIFEVIINGEKQEISLSNGEEKEFDLPEGAAYQVSEKDYLTEGYIQSSIVNGYGTGKGEVVEVVCTNTYLPTKVLTEISGIKTWDVPDGTKLPESITVYLMHGEQIVASETVTAKDNWKYTFKEIPKYDSSGKEIAYSVAEAPVDGYVSVVTGTDIQNIYVSPVVHKVPEIEKKVTVNGEGEAKEATFTFSLTGENGAPMPDGAVNQEKTIQLNGEGKVSFGDIIYQTAGTYVYTIKEMNGGTNGYLYDTTVYTYRVEVTRNGGELAAKGTIVKNADIENPVEDVVFTNVYTPETDGGDEELTSLTVNKVWAGTKNPGQPEKVEVQLFKNGQKEGESIVLSPENNWIHTWVGLNAGDAWTVDEVNVPDQYHKTITENGSQGYTITNTYLPEGNSNVEKPSNGQNGNGGSSGNINYQQSSGNKSGNKGPQTNDPGRIWMWIVLMAGSAIALRFTIFYKNPFIKK